MKNSDIAEALYNCDWSNAPIGNKLIIKQAAQALEHMPDLDAGVAALIDCLEDCADPRQGLILALRAMGVEC